MKHAWIAVVAAFAAFAAPAVGQQASLTLKDSSVAPCHHNETSWTLEKTGVLSGTTVTWTVQVARGATTHDFLAGDGFVRIANTGSAGATIGNIVVNLQRRAGNKWKTASSDVANSTQGDAATSAKIVAGASSEGLGVFAENAASGPLEFMDPNANTVFSLVPEFTLPAGATLDLFFQATFDNTILQIPAGEQVRFEVIVSFGNAGARGGSGASGKCIDIDGSGSVDADEQYVRSVPTRLTVTVPELEKCHDNVVLTDTADQITKTGTVTFSGFTTDIGEGAGVEILDAGKTFTVSVTVDAGTSGGTITNTARLDSDGDVVVVEGPLDSLGQPEFTRAFVCCPALHLKAPSKVVVPPPTPGPDPDPDPDPSGYRTYTQGGWGATPKGGNPGVILAANFSAVYPSGFVEAGLPGDGGYSMKFTSAAAIEAYLPFGTTAGVLTSDVEDPTSTSAGVFGSQVLALKLNVDFSTAGVTGFSAGFVDLKVLATGTVWDGLTVKQILGIAETALGGGGLAGDLEDLNDLVDALNKSFDNGEQSDWAKDHLGS